MPLRIAVDMDEVIADTFSHQLEWFELTHKLRWDPQELASRRFADVAPPHAVNALEELMLEGTFFRGLPVMPGSQDALRRLADRFEVFVTTAAMEYPRSFGPKFAWLEAHFPFIPADRVVFCGDKSVIRADYMIDDNVRHLRCFVGHGVLFSAAHNMSEEGFQRVHNWADAVAFLEQDAQLDRQS